MGTRNLTMVTLDGKRRVAQYCQWDGYPNGQGKTVAEFIANEMDLPLFKEKVAALKKITEKGLQKLWVECGAEPGSTMVNMDVSKKFSEKYPQYHRDTGAKVLAMIQNGEVAKVQLDEDFLNDGLFCEWAYELDLDREELIIYKGFFEKPKPKNDRDKYETRAVKTIPFADVEEEFGKILANYQKWQNTDQDEDFEISC